MEELLRFLFISLYSDAKFIADTKQFVSTTATSSTFTFLKQLHCLFFVFLNTPPI